MRNGSCAEPFGSTLGTHAAANIEKYKLQPAAAKRKLDGNEKAEIVAMTAEAIDKEAIARGGEILKRGGLVAFPNRDSLRSWEKCS